MLTSRISQNGLWLWTASPPTNIQQPGQVCTLATIRVQENDSAARRLTVTRTYGPFCVNLLGCDRPHNRDVSVGFLPSGRASSW